MNWQAVFFDFDGVILDSTDIKTKAFAEMFRPYGKEIEDRVVSYHLRYMGISRHEKIRYFHNSLLKKEISESKITNLGKEFSERVLTLVLEAPFIAGALETLDILKSLEIPAYIVSGTPSDEMNYIVEKRGLKIYFCETHGSPRRKNTIIEEIINRKNYQRSHCLFIGDAITDYDAAIITKINFMGIVKDINNSPFPKGTPISLTVKV